MRQSWNVLGEIGEHFLIGHIVTNEHVVVAIIRADLERRVLRITIRREHRRRSTDYSLSRLVTDAGNETFEREK